MMEYVSGNEMTVSYASLSPALFSETMKKYGCIMIRGLFAPEEVDHIKNETLDLFYVIKNLMHNKLLSPENESYVAGGHPAGILPSLASLEQVLNKTRFIDCLKDYFNKDEFVVHVESTGIRRCDPTEWKNYLPWHQDIFDRGDKFFTCWMPLMKIDAKTPGLDLIPKKMHQRLHQDNGLEVSYSGKGMSDEMLTVKASPLRWRPHMEVGDVLIFDPYCPHRTSFSEDYSVERYSIDIRIHPKDFMPEETWKTNIINLPSPNPSATKPDTHRSMFNFRHLIMFNAEPPPAVATETMAVTPTASFSARLKNFVRKLASV